MLRSRVYPTTCSARPSLVYPPGPQLGEASDHRRRPMIEQLNRSVTDSDVAALANLLVDAVESGAAVSFMAPLTLQRAEEWWRRILSESDARAIFLVARDGDGIVGTVQLHPAWAPNQPHRGEITKLVVHRRSR